MSSDLEESTISELENEPLQKPKKKRVYTPEQIEIMKENLRKGREKKAAAKETAKEVLELHSKLIPSNKIDQVKEHLQSKLKEKDLEDKIVSLKKKQYKKKQKKYQETDSESSSSSDDDPPPPKKTKKVKIPKQETQQLQPIQPIQPIRSIIRFV
jgi:hypothetical protein